MRSLLTNLRKLLSDHGSSKPAIDAAQLEDRVMLSATPLVDAVVNADPAAAGIETPAQTATVHPSLFDAVADNQNADEFRFREAATDAEQRQLDRADQATRLELVFVDTGAEDYQQLVDDLLADSDSTRELEAYLLDSNRDGIEHISEILSGYDEVDAVHLVSHGTEGKVKLGNVWLTSDNLSGYAGDIATWHNALSDDADLLIYGCDLAASEDGRTLTEAIGALCDCDVAASDDDTGHAALGGDWDLEYTAGTIDTSVAFSSDAQFAWFGLLNAAPDGSNFLVNTATGDVQRDADVAVHTTGESVVVWDGLDDGSGEGIFMRLYNADGSGKGAEQLVNISSTNNQQVDPSVAMDDAGNFVVTWVSTHTGVNGWNIFARKFDIDGNPIGGEIGVTEIVGDQVDPDIAMSSTGDFVIVWEGDGPTDSAGVYAQRFLANGTPNGGQFLINPVSASVQWNPSVAMRDSGDFVVTYTDQSGSPTKIVAQRVVGGAPQTPFDVHATVGGNEENPSVGIADSGDFVVAWEEAGGDSHLAGGTGDAVLFQRFLWDETQLEADDVVANSYVDNNQNGSSVAVSESGHFVITWSSLDQDGAGYGVYGQQYYANGTTDGPEFHVSTDETNNNQRRASVAMNAAGDYIVAWDGYGPTIDAGDSEGVFGQRYGTFAGMRQAVWLSTKDGGTDGTTNWDGDTLLEIGDPNFSLEPSTDGTISTVFDLVSNFLADGATELTGLHVVSRSVNIGGVMVQEGDVLFTVNGAQPDLTSSNTVNNVNKSDIVRFRPDTPGNYTAGEFQVVLSDPLGALLGADANLGGISLVEKGMSIGGVSVSAGDFLLVETKSADDVVYHYDTSLGAAAPLIEGGDIGIGTADFTSVHLIADTITIGGVTLTEGNVLVSVSKTITGPPDFAGLSSVSPYDVVALTVTSGGPSTAATGTLVFQGSEAKLETSGEEIEAFSLVPVANHGCNVADNFDDGVGGSTDFSGNDGTHLWTGDWVEVGESDGASTGKVRVDNYNGSYQLHLYGADGTGGQNPPDGAYRIADLSGATMATLTYDYDLIQGDTSEFKVQVSTDGSVWTTVRPYNYLGSQSGSESIDISTHISATTYVRFYQDQWGDETDHIYFDNIQIEHDGACPAATQAVNGTIYEDVDGDGAVLDDNQLVAGVTVDLYDDSGATAGEIDGTDALLLSTTTDGSGNYSFTGLADGTYWVVVDSTTVAPAAGFNGGYGQDDVWAEQTYGAAGAATFSGSFSYAGSAGALFGGMQNGVSDDASGLATAEHVTRVIVAGSNVNNVDSGFSFNVVTHSGDSDDDLGNDRTAQGTLRQAIQNANAILGATSIDLAADFYQLDQGSGDDNAKSGDLDIDDDLIITGTDPVNTIIDGKDLDRVFDIRGGATATMSGITIQNGNQNNGGGVFVDNTAILNISDATLSGNDNSGNAGGAIHVHGTLNATRVTFSGNTANDGGAIGFHGADGGTLINVTISGNSATGDGGGIWTDSAIGLTNVTITGNNAADAGGIFVSGPAVNISNTIVSGNTAGSANEDVAGGFSSDGFNLIETVGTATGLGSDITGQSANLAGLAPNGGLTETHAILAGSKAINAGTAAGAPPTDQRGVARVGATDIGAYEFTLATLTGTDEFTVNETPGDDQRTSMQGRGSHRSVAIAPDGNYVVVWSSFGQDGDGWGVYGQRFDKDGVPLGAEMRVSQSSVNDQRWASVAMDDGGNFVVTWTGESGGGTSIFARRFDEGTGLWGGEFQVNTSAGNQTAPSIAMDADGDFVIVWQGDGVGDLDSGIFGQRYSAAGVPQGEFLVNNVTGSNQRDASVSMDSSGNFVVIWDDNGGFHYRQFLASGAAMDVQQTITGDTTAGDGAVASHDDGTFVVVWRETVGSYRDVIAQRFNSANTAISGQITVNTTTTANTHQRDPSIAMDDNGDFIVVWEGEGDQAGEVDTYGIYGQKFNANATKVDNEFLINQITTNAQDQVSVAMLDLDNFVVAWTHDTALTFGTEIHARQFGTLPPSLLPAAVNDADTTDEDTAAVIDATGNDVDGPVHVVAATQPSAGSAVDNGDGTFTYTPDPNFFGADSFDYSIVDGSTSHYWGLDGDALDAVGSSHGTVNNGAATVSGLYGNALSFDEFNDHVVISDFNYASDFTVAFRFKVDDIAGNEFQYMFSHGDISGPNDLQIYIGETGSAYSGILLTNFQDVDDPNNVESLDVDINSFVGDSQWHTYTLTVTSGVGSRVYLDGKLEATSTQGRDAFDPDTDLYLGGRHDLDPDRYFSGDLDSVQILDRALDGKEVAHHHTDGTSTATVNVTVNPINDLPVAAADSYTIDEDTALNIPVAGVLANDTDVESDPIPGSSLNYDVDRDIDGDGLWQDAAAGGLDWSLHTNVARTDTPTTTLPGIGSAYVFDGSGGGATTTFEAVSGDPSESTASFELWFNPTDASGIETLFESGSTGSGVSLTLNGSAIDFTVFDGGSIGFASADISAEIAGNEFIQVVGVIDMDSAQPDMYLYVNGALVASDMDILGLTDWSNAGGSGLGAANGGIASFTSPVDYEGEIAAFRFYESALSGGDVQTNYDAIATGSSLTATNLDTGITVGLVVLNPDGSFSYDPNGQFENLNSGDTFVDTFTYTANDGTVDSNIATVSITVTGVNDEQLLGTNSPLGINEGATGTITQVLLETTDVDNTPAEITYTVISVPSYGTVLVSSLPSLTFTQLDINSGLVEYQHNGTENFADGFNFNVDDGQGTVSSGMFTINVTPVNDNTPVAVAETATVAEGGTITVLDGGTTSVLDNDTDADAPGDTLTAVLDSGPANAASFTLNGDGTFSYQHDGSENLSDSFSYHVFDGVNNSSTVVVNITVTPVNDNTPVADNETFTVGVGGTATEANLDVGTSLLDGDTDVDLPNDTLTVNTTPVAGPSFASSFTLNADGTFSYTHDGSGNLSDSFTYEVSDAVGNTDTATVTITITNSNPPVADAESFTVLEGGTATEADLDAGTSLLDGDTDLDLPGDTLTVDTTPVSGPSHGSLTLNADGTFSYTHDGTENLSDSFTYRVRDTANNADTATVTITVTPVNDNNPVAVAETATVAEGGTVTVLDGGATSVLDNDTDADAPGDTLTAVLDSGPANAASFTLNADGTFSYQHDGSENLSDSFSYHVFDGVNNSGTVVVNITVTPVNDNNPVAVAETATVAEGGTVTVLDGGATSVLDNDTDADAPGDTLTAVLDSGPANAASFTLNADGTFSYTHNGSENLSDSFSYHVFDGVNNSSTVVVNITITPVNDNNPVAVAETATVTEGGTVTVLDGGATSVLDNDTDADAPGDTLTTVLDSGPANAASFTLNGDGTFSYQHDGSENLSDSFSYHVFDGVNNSGTVVVNITITSVNDNTPVAVAETATVAEGGTVTVLDGGATSVLDNDTDADAPGDTLTAVLDSGPSNAVSFTLNGDGTFSYQHDGSENLSDSFSYHIFDGVNNSATVVVNITITPVNDNNPVAVAETATVTEGGTVTVLDGGATSVLDNDTDADAPGDTLTAVLDSGPANAASFTLNGDGTFSYQHDGSENLSDSFSYHVFDGVNNSSTVVVNITVTPVNDNAPVAVAETVTVAEGGTVTLLDGGATSVLANDSDADAPGDTLTAVLDSGPANASSFTLNGDGTFSYQHDGSETLSDSFSYHVFDGVNNSSTVVVNITVTPVNDNTPTAVAETATVAEGGTVTVLDGGATSVLDNDTDADAPGDTLTAVLDSGPANAASFTLNGDGTFSYQHDGSENLSDSFSYHVFDGVNNSGTVVVNITITPVNDNTPVAVAETATVAEGGTVTVLDGGATSVLDNDSDADLPGDTLTAVLDSGPSNAASFTLNGDGTFSYQHDGSENLSDSFSYHVFDGVNNSSTVVVNIAVTPVNDNAPVAVAETVTVAEGGTVTVLDGGATSVLDNDSDADAPGDTLTAVLDSGPANAASFTLNGDGTFSYTHDGSENLSDSFSYHVFDGVNNSGTVVVNITVTPVNDNTPVALAETVTVAEGGTITVLDGGATSVLDNDSDADAPGDTLTAVLDSGPANAASFTLNGDGTFSYQHDGSENFSDSFSYHVLDGVNNSATVVVSITITAVNENTPVPDNESFTVNIGSTATEANLDAGTSLLDGDTDVDLPLDALTVNTTPVAGPSHASSFTLNSDGTFSYTHDGTANFSDSFSYEVSDAAGNSATATVTITISNTNLPVADGESFTVLEGGTATHTDLDAGVNLLDGDTDLDLPGDTLTVDTAPVSGPNFGSLTLNADGTFSYTHDGSENFSDSFVYRVRDTANNTDTATVNITITPVNDNPPVADAESFTVVEGGTATEADLAVGTSLLDGDIDIDLPSDTLTVDTTPVSGPAHGTLVLNSDGTFSYTHDGSENLSDSFVYRVRDANNQTDTATVTITVAPVNDNTPLADAESFTVAEGGTATEADLDIGTSLLDGDADIDLPNDTLTVNTTPVSGPSHGSLTLNSDGSFSYTHDGSENFADAFTYQVIDANNQSDTATVTITITPVNDNPPLADNESFTVAEGGTAIEADLDVGASLLDGDTDIDLPNDTLIVNTTPVSGPSHGTLTLNSNGSFSYTHDGSENFGDSFSYQVIDANNQTDTATVTITVTPVNDNPPVAVADGVVVAEGGTATVLISAATSVLANDSDVDLPGDSLAAVLDSGPTFASSFTLNADGTFSYTHDGSENFGDSFSYHAQDGTNNGNTVVVSINISPVNDAPVAHNDSYAVDAGDTLTVVTPGVMDNDTDAEGDAITVVLETGPSDGTLTLAADGSLVYTPDLRFSGTDSFTYRIDDGTDVGNVAMVTIDVTGIAVIPPTVPIDPPPPDDEPTTEEEEDPSVDPSPSVDPPEADPAPVGTPRDSGRESPTDTRALRPLPLPIETETATEDVAQARSDSASAQAGVRTSVSRFVAAATMGIADARAIDEFFFVTNAGGLWDELDDLEEQLTADPALQSLVVGSAIGGSSMLTVGYVLWMIRGGYLVASMISSIPAWQMIDPLVVLNFLDGKDEEDKESIESMLEKARREKLQERQTEMAISAAEETADSC